MKTRYKVAIGLFLLCAVVAFVLFVGYLRALGGFSYGIGPR